MNMHRLLMLILIAAAVGVISIGTGIADVGPGQAICEVYTPVCGTSVHNIIGNNSYDILISNKTLVQDPFDSTLNTISEETKNKQVLFLENGYIIRITDINKDVSSYKMRLILEKKMLNSMIKL